MQNSFPKGFPRARIPGMKLLLPTVAAIFLAGCSTPQPTVGGALPTKVYARVISLSPSTTELLSMLLSENVLVGRTSMDTQPVSISAITIVANPRPDFEKIVQLQPDLIIVDLNVINPADLQKLQQLSGPNKFDVVAFKIHSIKDWEDAVWKLGAMVNQFGEASKHVDFVEESIRRSKTDPITPKPRAIVAMGGSRPWVTGTESFQADAVRGAGGEAVGPAGDKFVPVNPEQIMSWKPDIVFVPDSAGDDYSSPAWKATKAAIIRVNPDVLLRPGGRVDHLIDGLARELRNSVPSK